MPSRTLAHLCHRSSGALVLAFAGGVLATAHVDAQPAEPAPTDVAPAGLLSALEQRLHERFVDDAKAGGIDLVFIGDSAVDFWRQEGKPEWDRNFAGLGAAKFGVQGADTRSVLWRLQNGELDGLQAKVIVFAGMYSSDRTDGLSDAEILKGNAAIVAEIRKRQPQAKILLMAVPRSPYPDAPLRPLEMALQDHLAGLADGDQVRFLDLRNTFFRPDGSLDSAVQSGRGSAMNAQGYAAWARAMQPQLAELMGRQLVAAPTPAARAAPGSLIEGNTCAVRSIRLFDGTTVSHDVTVVVRDGLIAKVGKNLTVPLGMPVIDGSGKTLLPGLIDAHAHTAFEAALADELRFGVTTELDMFSPPRFAANQRPRRTGLERTRLADMWSAGTLVTSPGGHGTQAGIIPTISGPDEAEAFVRARIADGSDYIKIVYEPDLPNLTSISRETLEATIRAAHGHGKMALMHATHLEAAREAVAAGADGLVHVFIHEPIDDAMLELMVREDVFVVPTLSVYLSLATDEQTGQRLAADGRLAPYLSRAQREFLASTRRPALPAEIASIDPRHARRTVAMLQDKGIDILVGSDADNPGTAHGVTVHGEMAELVRAGMTPLEALTSATSIPAERFGLTDRGRIAPGLRADLLLVEGDPTTDILATRSISRVFKNGFEIDRSASGGMVEP